jgi:hypothetical protein
MSRTNDTIADSESGPTYMDLVLSGDKLAGDIDDFVDAWHEAPDGSTAASLGLAEYLGMTEDEYQLWVEQPDSLGFIAAAHKTKQPVERLLASRDELGLAARTGDQTEAERLVQWLIKRGRIEDPKRPW